MSAAVRRLGTGLGVVLGLALLVVVNFVLFQPVKVVPRLGLGPGYALIDQTGSRLTSEDLRGTVAVYTIGYPACDGACPPTDSIFRSLQARLPEAEPGTIPIRLVTLSPDPGRATPAVPDPAVLDPATTDPAALDPAALDPAVLDSAARALGADPAVWTFATGEPAVLNRLIGTAFGLRQGRDDAGRPTYEPAVMIVDGNGILRRAYRHGLPSVERLVTDLRLIAREARATSGAERLAYEAAHLFACYSN